MLIIYGKKMLITFVICNEEDTLSELSKYQVFSIDATLRYMF